MKRLVVVIASALALTVGGSTAMALGPADPTLNRSPSPDLSVPHLSPAVPAPAAPAAPGAPGVAAVPPTGIPFVDALLAPGDPAAAEPGPGPEATPAALSAGEQSAAAAPATTRRPVKRPVNRPLPTPEEFGPGLFAGYSTGTIIHADALQAGDMRLADVEVAFSGAEMASKPLAEPLVNEMQRVIAPAIPENLGFGRGSGLELGLIKAPSAPSQLVLADLAEAAAPPAQALINKQIGPITVDPLVKATLLRGQALSRAAAKGCTLASDLGYGLGYAADVRLLNLGDDFDRAVLKTSAEGPNRAVSQSRSRTRLVPREGGPADRFGMVSVARETIAPITFFAGTDNQFTIEVLGEWVLQAKADGKKGSLHYGPADKSPETPILRIIDRHGKVTTQLTTQDLLGDDGLVIEIPGIAEVAVGEDPRAIGGDAASKPTETPTIVLGAVDVVRVRLLHQDDRHLADVRIGHMEVGTIVPEGGIECPGIGMTKKAEPDKVKPGDVFDWVLTVSNPNHCNLKNVKVVDVTTVTRGVKYHIVSSEPKADAVEDGEIIFPDIGPLGHEALKELRIKVKVHDDSGAGRFTGKATATGKCGAAVAEGTSDAAASSVDDLVLDSTLDGLEVPLEGAALIDTPEVGVSVSDRTPADSGQGAEVVAATVETPKGDAGNTLPRTGGMVGALTAIYLLGGGSVLRRLGRRRTD